MVVSGSAKDPSTAQQILERTLLLTEETTNLDGPTYGTVIDSFLETRSNTLINKLLVQGGILKKKTIFFVTEKWDRLNY